jgi:hypothetical protein
MPSYGGSRGPFEVTVPVFAWGKRENAQNTQDESLRNQI